MLTISVKNLGPIAEGSVDLKPLTIFVGPSNTGKSYMATAVYAVMRAVEGRPQVPYTRHLEQREVVAGYRTQWEVPAEVVESIREWVKGQDGSNWQNQDIPITAFPRRVESELTKSINQVLSWLHGDVMHQVRRSYKGNSEIVTRGSRPEDFFLALERNSPFLKAAINLTGDNKDNCEFDISRASVRSSFIEYWGHEQHRNEENYPSAYSDLFFALRISAAENVFEGLPYNSYFLPASRTGIVQSQKILASSIIRQSSLLGAQRVNIPALPGVTTEFLSDLVSLDKSLRSHHLNDQWDKAVDFIESNVLHGEIDLDESAGLPYPEIAYKTAAGQFTLEHSSAMVSELAPLILFLKYLIGPGDLLILEEPESHLHPAAQRQLARGIVRLVNAGVKVLITTHSDIIISQINNLLALRQASPELVEQGGFEAEDFLQPDQVGAYLFRYNQELGGCETVDLEIDPDTGIDEDQFASVFEAIYDESIALQRDRN